MIEQVLRRVTLIDMAHLLVFSHAGVLGENRSFYHQLAKLIRDPISLVVPISWKNTLGGDNLSAELRYEPTKDDALIEVIPLPVSVSGNSSLFFYNTRLSKRFKSHSIRHVFVDEEPWSVATQQAFRAFPNIRRSFYTKQSLQRNVLPPFIYFQSSVFKNAEFAFASSGHAVDCMRHKGFNKPIYALEDFYDPNLYKPTSESERLKAKRQFGIPEDAFVVFYSGSLSEEKGVEDLLNAMSSAQKKLKNIYFLLSGSGPLLTRVTKEVRDLGPKMACILKDFAQDKSELLKTADVLVVPSRSTRNWQEYSLRQIIEAMASKVAVVSSDSGVLPDFVKASGGGLVFNEANASQLFDSLEKLQSDPALLNSCKEKGFDYVKEKFNIQDRALDFAKILGLELK